MTYRKTIIMTMGLAALALHAHAQERSDTLSVPLHSQESPAEPAAVEKELQAVIDKRREDDVALNEDPEELRRNEAQRQREAQALDPRLEPEKTTNFDFYGSVRAHWINTVDLETLERKSRVGDGNSRVGLEADWQFRPGWYLYGRAEAGFDVVENFTTRGDAFGDGGLTTRLLYAGLDSEYLTLLYGKNWSAYYQIAGITDRFAIFGGSGSGVYAAGTSGQAIGTGRADDVVQTRLYIDPENILKVFKPFNVNLQYQLSQPIPNVEGESYDYGFGASAWLETETERGVGLAYNRSRIGDPGRPAIANAGIDGDAEAAAITARIFGSRWYVSALLSRLKNLEVTDKGKFVDGTGGELYAQWEFLQDWWLIGGGNAFEPDSDDADAGEFRTRYAVIGGRYSFESFKRMAYFEYRIDDSRSFDGIKGKNEFTVGVRWDFGKR